MKIKSIQVLGTGCTACKTLLEITKKTASELEVGVEVEYITDMTKIVEMGVMTTPALAVNEEVVLSGAGRTEEDVKKALEDSEPKKEGGTCGCQCGGQC